MPINKNAAATDLGLLIMRVVLGVVMFVHGYQKLTGPGFGGMEAQFAQTGAPFPAITGPLTLVAELAGGPLLILGLLTRPVAAALVAVMAGAIGVVHGSNGFFVKDGGYEFVLTLLAGCLLFVLAGPGRFSLDHPLSASLQRARGRDSEVDLT